jgi:hypothetical protein
MVTTRHPSGARRAKRLATLAAALALCATPATRAALAATGAFEASVDPQIVDAGDPVRLTLRFHGDAPGTRPDLSPLTRDFDVLGSQQSQRVSIVNGAIEQTRELQILLSPKHDGEIEIPALHAGDVASEPLRLTVRDGGAGAPGEPAAAAPATAASRAAAATSTTAPSASTTDNAATRAVRNGQAPPDLFVDASIDQTSPFVQGEVRYTVRVYDGLGIREGALTEPAANGVRLEPRGDTRTYEDVVAGRRYMVHERVYAAFPQTSGEVMIPPVVLQARVPDAPGRGRRSAFDDMSDGDDVFAEMFAQMRRSGFGGAMLDRMMDSGHEVRVRSNPVTLSVQGRPADAANGWFLPATSVTLAQSWSTGQQPSFRVGETITRTVTLRAEGASASQMPTLTAGDVSGVKQYAGKPETRGIAGGAELVQSFDVLPTTAGAVTLPRIEVPWWDTASATQRTAVLAEQTIDVLPAASASAQQAASLPSAATQPNAAAHAAAPSTVATGDPTGTLGAAPASTTAQRGLLAAAAVLLLTLSGGAAWTIRRRRFAVSGATASGTSGVTVGTSRVTARALVDEVQRACAANDPRAVRDALLAWGRATWSDAPPVNAAAVARRLGDGALVAAVKSLDDSLYAPHTSSFDGAAFRRAFDGARRAGTRGGDDSAAVLPALYPESRLA